MKIDTELANKLKIFFTHVVLIFIVLVVLLPVLYMASAGFRKNQAIYGPLVDLNTWIDDSVANRRENKISKRKLYKRLQMVFSGFTEDQVKDWEKNKKKFKSSDNSAEYKQLKKQTKKWINKKNKGDSYQVFIDSYNKWIASKDVHLKKQIDKQIFYGSQPRYKYDIRISLINYKGFFTGKSVDLKDVEYPMLKWFGNSLFISTTVMVVQVLVIILAAYALSRFRFYGKKSGILFILTLQVFPSTMTMVALYLFLQYVGDFVPALGVNTKLGLILIYLGIGVPLNIWITKGYFDNLPKEMEESAIIDGASYTQVFRYIILPLTKPIIAVVAILSFIAAYNEFMLALFVITKAEHFTLPVGLSFFASGYFVRFGIFSAAAVIGALPVTLIWMFLQESIISGLTHGSVKH